VTPADAVPFNVHPGIRVLIADCRELPQQASSQAMQWHLIDETNSVDHGRVAGATLDPDHQFSTRPVFTARNGSVIPKISEADLR
jgi:hypothetical protein